MTRTKNSIQKLGILTGIIVSVVLIAYFLLMQVCGLLRMPQFSMLNFVILLGGLIFAYSHYRKQGKNIDYMSGAALGMTTTAVGIAPYTAFLYIYLAFVDETLLTEIKSDILTGEYLTPFSAAGSVLIIGLSYGLILSFILMQYYKSRDERIGRKESLE